MSETLRDLVVSLSLNSDNFSRNIKSINKQIQEAESAFRLASAGVENFETTTAGLSSKLSTLQRTFQLQQDAVGQYERALQQASDKLQECYARQNDYAQRLEALAAASGGETENVVRITGDTVNVRRGPGTEYESIGIVRKGDTLPAVAAEDWLPVLFGGEIRWVSMKYASLEPAK